MSEWSDETLMAYVDGEVDPRTAADLDAALRHDPALAERIEVFRRTLALSTRAFEAPMHQEVPERLLRVFQTAAPGRAVQAPVSERRGTITRMLSARWALPLAASITLVVGLAGGWHLTRAPLDSGSGDVGIAGTVSIGSPVHLVLETSPSTVPVSWSGADESTTHTIVPILTFRATDGRYCREFESTSRLAVESVVRAAVGVACRSPNGHWQTEMLTASGQGTAEADVDSYEPASGEEMGIIDRYLDQVMAEPALGSDAEQRLLETGWQ